jgi:hypothetical protein
MRRAHPPYPTFQPLLRDHKVGESDLRQEQDRKLADAYGVVDVPLKLQDSGGGQTASTGLVLPVRPTAHDAVVDEVEKTSEALQPIRRPLMGRSRVRFPTRRIVG